jgi:hypothetical protein
MLKRVAADVRRATQNGQRPQQLTDMTRTFYFAGESAGAPVPPAAAPVAAAPPPSRSADQAIEVAFWNAALAANDCDSVRAYLRRFPAGAFIDLARLAERRQCGTQAAAAAKDASAASAAGEAPRPSTDRAISIVAAPAASTPARPAAPAPAVAAPAAEPVVKPLAALPDAQDASQKLLARTLQLELLRVGCGPLKPSDAWNEASRKALGAFNRHAKTDLDTSAPTEAAVAAVREHDSRVCPLVCGKGQKLSGDTCVAEPRTRARKTVNVEPAAPAPRITREPPRKPRTIAPRPPRTAAPAEKPAPDGSSLFTQGGRKCRLVPINSGGGHFTGDTRLICD